MYSVFALLGLLFDYYAINTIAAHLSLFCASPSLQTRGHLCTLSISKELKLSFQTHFTLMQASSSSLVLMAREEKSALTR